MTLQVHRQAIIPTELQLNIIKSLDYRKTPSFLGNFDFKCFGGKYGRNNKLPSELLSLVEQLAALRPEQKFNALFIQRYLVGQSVKSHRDPKDNVDHTLILVLGDFEGARTTIGNQSDQLNHGDVLELPCTINGVQGPTHSVSAVTSGERYTVILNTII